MLQRHNNWEKRARQSISAQQMWNQNWLIFATDVSRVDFRLDAEGNPRLIEINPLPGLTPGYSDLCIQAAAEGIAYEELILEILYLAAGRWSLLEPREIPLEVPKKKR